MLPDEVLLAIFDFCAHEDSSLKRDIEAWQRLVHVCRQWRTVVFGSPRRLNLRLVCGAKTPARDTLDVWPALRLVIERDFRPIENMDNVVAVLERSNRVCRINLDHDIPRSDLGSVLVAMQVPFPELTDLQLRSFGTVAALPDSFLGGSVPSLRHVYFRSIPFPGLPKLLLSATHLVSLILDDIPHSGYFSPEAMVTAFSTLTGLQYLWLGFESPRSCPDRENRRPPPPTRFVLPVFTRFWFKGVAEYLDDLVACIDAPRLYSFVINFFNHIISDTPQLIQFISRTPTLNPLEKASVSIEDGTASLSLTSQTSEPFQGLHVNIPCRGLDRQVSSVAQVCTSCLPPLFILETLYIFEKRSWRPEWKDNIENTLWLQLLHPFAVVKNLYLSKEFALHIVPALQELDGGRTTEVLPALENIFLERLEPSGPVQEGVGQFVATRQVTGHPIAVSRWDRRDGR